MQQEENIDETQNLADTTGTGNATGEQSENDNTETAETQETAVNGKKKRNYMPTGNPRGRQPKENRDAVYLGRIAFKCTIAQQMLMERILANRKAKGLTNNMRELNMQTFAFILQVNGGDMYAKFYTGKLE